MRFFLNIAGHLNTTNFLFFFWKYWRLCAVEKLIFCTHASQVNEKENALLEEITKLGLPLGVYTKFYSVETIDVGVYGRKKDVAVYNAYKRFTS